MMNEIKFGTDGWRAIIAKDFTVQNVLRVTHAVLDWIGKHKINEKPVVVLGHDCRFGGELFVETIAKYLASNGVEVLLGDGFVSTPMISFACKESNADMGIIITASHNPPSYNGYKLKGRHGGPLNQADVQAIQDLIPDFVDFDVDEYELSKFQELGLMNYLDLEGLYFRQVKNHFDLDKLRSSGIRIAYDAMYGSGQKVMRRILPEAAYFRCEHNPTFFGISPEPIKKNLGGFSDFIQGKGNIDLGIITDGDADRIGLMDGEGNFIDSHHILLLLILFLKKYKKWEGKVCTGFSSTVKIKALCEKYSLDLSIVPIGFKHISEMMVSQDVLVGGEESGGIAIKGHIPERDGIWIGLTIMEFMIETGKSIQALIQEVYDEIGVFGFQRIDLRLPEATKAKIVENCMQNSYTHFGDYAVTKTDNLDGFKYFFDADRWVMIRPSGTEPVLRTYAEGKSVEEAGAILKATHETILGA